MQTDIHPLGVGGAVMQMELAQAPLLVFKSVANGRLNIALQREDGHIE